MVKSLYNHISVISVQNNCERKLKENHQMQKYINLMYFCYRKCTRNIPHYEVCKIYATTTTNFIKHIIKRKKKKTEMVK